MRKYRYHIVDVFTTTPFAGNPLAVLPDVDGIGAAAMQQIAREFNLSEAVFISKSQHPGCALRFRIFTPTAELRFAGHPTIGGAFVALQYGLVAGATEGFSIEEPVGPVPVRIELYEPRLWLTTPPITFGTLFDRRACADALGLEDDAIASAAPQIVSAGTPFTFIALRDITSVDRAWLDIAGEHRLHGSTKISDGVFVFAPTPNGAYSRMFAPENGIVEDPATGGATGPLAAYMMRHGYVSKASGTRFVSEQGTKMGRPSFLHVHIRGEEGANGIDIGGSVVPIAEGTLFLP